MLGWVAHVYLKKEGIIHHLVVRNLSLQYDVRSDWQFGERVGTWNIGSLSRKGGEVCEELREWLIDGVLFTGFGIEWTGF